MLAIYSSGLRGKFFVLYLQFIFKFKTVSKRKKKKPPKQNNDAHPCVLRDTKQFTKGRWDDAILCSSICHLRGVKPWWRPCISTGRLFLGSVSSVTFNSTTWFKSRHHSTEPRPFPLSCSSCFQSRLLLLSTPPCPPSHLPCPHTADWGVFLSQPCLCHCPA